MSKIRRRSRTETLPEIDPDILSLFRNKTIIDGLHTVVLTDGSLLKDIPRGFHAISGFEQRGEYLDAKYNLLPRDIKGSVAWVIAYAHWCTQTFGMMGGHTMLEYITCLKVMTHNQIIISTRKEMEASIKIRGRTSYYIAIQKAMSLAAFPEQREFELETWLPWDRYMTWKENDRIIDDTQMLREENARIKENINEIVHEITIDAQSRLASYTDNLRMAATLEVQEYVDKLEVCNKKNAELSNLLELASAKKPSMAIFESASRLEQSMTDKMAAMTTKIHDLAGRLEESRLKSLSYARTLVEISERKDKQTSLMLSQIKDLKEAVDSKDRMLTSLQDKKQNAEKAESVSRGIIAALRKDVDKLSKQAQPTVDVEAIVQSRLRTYQEDSMKRIREYGSVLKEALDKHQEQLIYTKDLHRQMQEKDEKIEELESKLSEASATDAINDLAHLCEIKIHERPADDRALYRRYLKSILVKGIFDVFFYGSSVSAGELQEWEMIQKGVKVLVGYT